MFDIFIFIISLAVVIWGANIFFSASLKLSYLLRLPKAVIGATIVSLATTMPEITIAFFSGVTGHQDLALGNALGTPVANLGLIFGALILFTKPKVSTVSYFVNSFYLLLVLLVIFGLAFLNLEVLDGALGSRAGVILISLGIGYLVVNWLVAPKKGKSLVLEHRLGVVRQETIMEVVLREGRKIKMIVEFFSGAILLIIGSRLLVSSGGELAQLLGVGEILIGLTLVAVGTSIPELATAITAFVKREQSLSAGNLLGASVLTLTLALGVTAVSNPILVTQQLFRFHIPVILLFAAMATIATLFAGVWRFSLGIGLLVLYIFYIVYTAIIFS